MENDTHYRMSLQELGSFLKAARNEKGISQLGVASLLGFRNGQAISNVERGIVPLPARHVKRISEILGLDRSVLIERIIAIKSAQIRREAGDA